MAKQEIVIEESASDATILDLDSGLARMLRAELVRQLMGSPDEEFDTVVGVLWESEDPDLQAQASALEYCRSRAPNKPDVGS